MADWGFIYLHIGAPERALEFYEERGEGVANSGSIGPLWHSSYAPVRKSERFKKVVEIWAS